ncbi:hypothetical protein JW930_03755 [Candidatus Woesearchaeota archaeon]|nr:hypothetical protein [Candidatus Woesearchaeota archaeon]
MKKAVDIIVLSALSVAICLAQSGLIKADPENLVIRFIDIQSREIIRDMQADLFVTNTVSLEQTTLSQFIGESGEIETQLDGGEWNITAHLDDISTSGKDYYGRYIIRSYEFDKMDLFILPVGSIRGTVLDKLDNLVSNAKLKFDCQTQNGGKFPISSDEFGSFSYDYAPVGQCRVSAMYNGAAGFENVIVEKGNTTEIMIRLNKTVVSKPRLELDFGFILMSIIIAVIGVFFVFGKKEKKGKDKTAAQELHKRTKDVFSTLSEREKIVVSFLLDNNMESTQNIIKYKTRIPKTSLVRILHSLENKKIISLEKIGNLKKIKLTTWFLGKE